MTEPTEHAAGVVTEPGRLASGDVCAMLAFVAGRNPPAGAVVPAVPLTVRKLRLFLAGCSRVRWDLLRHPAYRAAVEVAERFADGAAAEQESAAAAQVAQDAVREFGARLDVTTDSVEWHAAYRDVRASLAVRVACAPAAESVREHASHRGFRRSVPDAPPDRLVRAESALVDLAWAMREHLAATLGDQAPDRAATVAAESARSADLLRCVAGGPFRPVAVAPAWLTPTVVGVASGVYDGRRFHDLPVLADALEDAGCDDGRILSHCRGPSTPPQSGAKGVRTHQGPHVRGCWVVDALLGRA